MPRTKKNRWDDASARQLMGWDLTDLFVRAAVMYIAYPGDSPETNRRRSAAADRLVEEWEKRCGTPPQLVDILPAWWVAARKVCDVAEILTSWGTPPTVLFRPMMERAAMEFADAMGMSPKKFAKEMDLMGLPRPPLVDHKGKSW
jgi:hypothetical protein